MEHVNWFVVLVVGIWTIAGMATIFTKKEDHLQTAALTTVIIGIGYLILKWSVWLHGGV